jgi:hypothetical protein
MHRFLIIKNIKLLLTFMLRHVAEKCEINIEIAYNSLENSKDKIDEMEKSGIYKIVCAICRAFYIG